MTPHSNVTIRPYAAADAPLVVELINFVRPTYQRRGIGRALMLTAFRAFWHHGIKRIILDTDRHSFTAAPQFYEHLGMRAYRREWLYEKIVRPGREMRRLQP
jgi:GNAT superfamily N-acetyltransferase